MTATSTPRLSEYARHFIYPAGIKRTVFTRVQAKGAELGLGFDWWQSQLGTVCLGYGADGRYCATVGGIGMSIPRQVGKTYFVLVLLVIMCILFPGLQVVWSAHHLRTSTKTFTSLRGICRRKKVAPHVLATRAANGEQQVEFRNGSMIMFGSRKMGFGRGFDEIDIEVFDEAQILDVKSLEDMIAATNQARHEHGALLFFMGTPPRPDDPSEAFVGRRAKALKGKAPNAVWLEIGAEPGSHPDDRSQWPKMNPSFPKRTPAESMERLRENLEDDDSWNREGRGVWDEDGSSLPGWAHRRGPRPEGIEIGALAVSAEVDQRHCSITAAGANDGRVFARSLAYGPGISWAVEQIHALYVKYRVPVAIAKTGPASSLIEPLEDLGVDLRKLSSDDLCNACAEIARLADDDMLTHPGDAETDRAVGYALRKSTGKRWVWGQRESAGDISPLEAVTWAAWVALYPEGGANVFLPKRRVQSTLVVGPLADLWAEANEPGATTAEHMAAWERDRYRRQHAARVVVVLDDYADFRPSKYGREELVTIGGDL